MRKLRPTAWLLLILIVLTLAFIWGNSLDNRETSSGKSDTIVALLKPLLMAVPVPALHTPDGMSAFVRKLAHFAEFFLLGAEMMALSLTLHRPEKLGPFRVLLLSLAAGLIDESLQFFSTRAPLLRDVLLDLFGALCGIVTLLLLRRIWTRLRRARVKGEALV
ncbi:MAG: VanZ family protein [Christensenellales bacterium]